MFLFFIHQNIRELLMKYTFLKNKSIFPWETRQRHILKGNRKSTGTGRLGEAVGASFKLTPSLSFLLTSLITLQFPSLHCHQRPGGWMALLSQGQPYTRHHLSDLLFLVVAEEPCRAFYLLRVLLLFSKEKQIRVLKRNKKLRKCQCQSIHVLHYAKLQI